MFRARQKIGKYQIERRIAEGPFANVYQALDTIEGVRVALKVPHPQHMTKEVLSEFRDEARLMARLDHPNILPLKDASFIDSHFVIVMPLGVRTLAERLQKRLSLPTALHFADQMLDGVAYSHLNHVMHCDIKPENFILFAGNRLRLTDFGIAKVAYRTVQGAGWGTLGYIAPEQAVGKPSFRSDVFSLGLVIYRLVSGCLPEWPYQWPPCGFDRVRKQVHPELVDILRKALEFDSRKRYRDAGQMWNAFRRVKARALRHTSKKGTHDNNDTARRDWQAIRRRQFQREHGKQAETRYACQRCEGPVAETMWFCPWCGSERPTHREPTRFPAQCPRCGRGMKLDWKYCPWCFGPGFEVATTRQFSDVRYSARCSNPKCTRKLLMPLMKYCPWCRAKTRKQWKIPGTSDRCPSCKWGVFGSYWDHCPWCGKSLHRR